MNAEVLANKTDVRRDTWLFWILSMVSCFFYYSYWAINFVKTVVENEKERNLIVVLLFIEATINILYFAAIDVDESAFFNLVSFILLIVASLKSKKYVESFVEAHGHPRKLSMLWTVIFNFFYFYYTINCIRNAKPEEPKEDPVVSQIKQLHDLKESGVLSEEEFETKKAQILNN